MTPAEALKKSLLGALRDDDAASVGAILEELRGWPSHSPWSDYELLLRAVKSGCKRVARLLLDRGARVRKKPRVNGPLHEAAARLGWTGLVEALLARGARVADVNRRGDTALHVAFAHRKSAELVDLLLEAHLRDGAGDVVNADGLSLLHIACTRPSPKFAKALLEAERANVNLQVPAISSSSYAGYTPLHFAVKFGQHDVVELLLDEYDAEVYVQDANGSTPLHLALECRDFAMIDLVLRYENRREDCCNKFGLTHFMAACAGSVESLVEEYLRVAPYRSWTEPDTLVSSQVQHRPNYPNAGYTPLHFAAEFGRVDSAKILLRLGARCFATAAYNATPFALACKRNHADVCVLLSDFCAGTYVEPSTKKRRSDRVEDAGSVCLENPLKKRKVSWSGSVVDDDSTSTSSSTLSSPSDCFVESFFGDPLTLCVNPLEIFEQNDADSACQDPRIFDFYDDVDCKTSESSSELVDDLKICIQGVCNLRIDTAIDYSSICGPKDVESDFYEPLDDVVLDDIFDFACAQLSANDIDETKNLGLTFNESVGSSPPQIIFEDAEDLEASLVDDIIITFNKPKDLGLTFNESLGDSPPQILIVEDADKLEASLLIDDQVKFDDLFDKYMKEKVPARIRTDVAENLEKSFVDEQVQFDELFEKYIKQQHLPQQDDFESSFVNGADFSLTRELEITEQDSGDSGCVATDDLDTTLEVSSSSSESDVLEKASRLSDFSDVASTVAASSDYDSDSSIENVEKNVCSDCNLNVPARSISEKKIEVVFVEMERLDDRQPKYVNYCEIEHDQSVHVGAKSSAPKSSDISGSFVSSGLVIEDTEDKVKTSDFLDTFSASQSRVNSLAPFQFQNPNECQSIFDDRNQSSFTVDFARY